MGRWFAVTVVGFWTLACASGEAIDDDEVGGDRARTEEHMKQPADEEEPEPKKPATKGKQAKLLGLQQGDIACYVELKTKDGEELSLHGDFELCPGGGSDASGLIGQRVRYETETSKVQAASCEGDPECTDSEDVELVVALKAAK